MGLFDFLKKKSTEELFQEAVAKQDYIEIMKYGKELLQREPYNLSILNPYVDALVKLGKKDQAIKLLTNFGEKKIKEEYYDVAIPVLKKALKIDPLNTETVKNLVSAFQKKELYYDAFNTLIESYKKHKEAGLPTGPIKELLEKFLQEQFHPIFYEKYGDLLLGEGEREKALINYVLAANMFMNLNNHKSALRALLKAQKIKKTENIDRQIVEAAAHIRSKRVEPILLSLIDNYKENIEFLKNLVEAFKKANNLPFLKELVKRIKNPKLKFILLALINYELGEVEEGQEYLEKLKILDKNAYEKVVIAVKTKHETSLPAIQLESIGIEELPEPEQVLDVLEQALEVDEFVEEFSEQELEKRPEEISKEISTLKEMEKDGGRYISVAEAYLGLGKLEQVIETAKEALDTKEAFKAISLIAEAYKQLGDYRKVLSFLLDQIHNPNLTKEEKARLKELLGDVNSILGYKDKALLWYKDAQKVLNDEELQKKIEELTADVTNI